MQAKKFDDKGPTAPALVTADEVRDPHALDITLRLNGEVMQQTNTSDFIFDIPTMLSYISEIMTLEPRSEERRVGKASKPPGWRPRWRPRRRRSTRGSGRRG